MSVATQRFLDEIRGSHTVYAYVDVTSPDSETERLVAVDGEVNVDRTAATRRAGRISCIDPEGKYIPDGVSGLLTPFGTEIRPYRGVRYTDGTIEVYPLGVFRLSKSSFSDAGNQAGVKIDLELFDLSRTVARDKFTDTYTVPQDTNVIDAIKLILARTFPNLEYDSISTQVTTSAPVVYSASDDPWTAVTDLAKSAGCEIFFDTEGWAVIAPPTDVDALPSPDFTYIEGQSSTMLDLQRVFSDEPGFNGVIVQGESPGDEKPPVRAEVWDTEPSSPTYRFGPYGEVPMFVTDTNVKTVEDAEKMADSLLKGQIGFSAQLSISAWTNPVLECGAVIEVVRSKLNVNSLYTVDAFNIPLRKDGTQNLRLRTKRIAS